MLNTHAVGRRLIVFGPRSILVRSLLASSRNSFEPEKIFTPPLVIQPSPSMTPLIKFAALISSLSKNIGGTLVVNDLLPVGMEK